MRFASLAALALALALAPATALAQQHDDAATPAPVEVMVLGVYHFNNPGLDMVNVEADDVLTPERQADLQAITEALAEWAPTRILLEAQPDTEDLHMESYRENAAQRVAEDRNEHFQIGYRLALRLGHEDVYGFDEQGEEGEPDYFPIQTVQQWAADNDAMADFGAMVGRVQAIVEEISADDAECSIARNLMQHNDPELAREAHGAFYYGLLDFGDADAQPGAETNAYWYMRNAKMFAKVGLIAEPGDRVLIVVGAGHKFWLDHFADLAEGYVSVDPRPYLEAADDGRCS